MKIDPKKDNFADSLTDEQFVKFVEITADIRLMSYQKELLKQLRKYYKGGNKDE